MSLVHNKIRKIVAMLFLLIACGLFTLQMGYLFLPSIIEQEVEYVHHQLFYIINITCIASLAVAFLLLFKLRQKWLLMIGSIFIVFIAANSYLIYSTSQQIDSTVSLSPEAKHMLVLKQDQQSGDIIYYRPRYYLAARPEVRLPSNGQELHVKWLADDVAAITYQTANNSIHQHIATYGDRGGGISYYNVGPEIQGEWQEGETRVISSTEGILVEDNGERHRFGWESIQQYGTLAIVLNDGNNAVYTIALAENFEAQSDSAAPQPGDIRLYKATMGDGEVMTLERVGG